MVKVTPSSISLVLILIILFAIFYIAFNLDSPNQDNDKLSTTKENNTTVKINGVSISAEIANTPKTRTSGLSNRERLAEDSGMLFIFDNSGYHTFWMKDMNFPIDIIWIHDNRIVDITENIPPEKDNKLTIYKPSKPVKFVLEVNAGFSEKNNFKVGDTVEISLKIKD